jgi:hypothetical protein
MLTQKEKELLLKLINSVQVSGTRATIGKTLEELDALTRKVEAMTTVEETSQPENEKAARS